MVEKPFDNDITWYTRNPKLVAAASQIPYPYVPGMELPIWVDPNEAQLVIPGVMALDWIPMPGRSKTNRDPASVASVQIYARVRDAYSGKLYADPPDFMIYLACLDSIFAYIAYLKRIYRVCAFWTGDNLDFPNLVLNAMRIPDAAAQYIRANRERFWGNINELVYQSRQFTCPALMDMLNRHYWMSDNIYSDAPSLSGQMYLFNLVGVHQFYGVEDGASVTGTNIVPLPHQNWPSTPPAGFDYVESFYSFGLDLLQRFAAWDDCYTINGYLKRAYDGVPNFVVSELEFNEVIRPEYSEIVLSQIENSWTSQCGPLVYEAITANDSELGLTQVVSTNTIVTKDLAKVDTVGQSGYTGTSSAVKPFLSVRSDAPTIADTILASRLKLVEDQVLDPEGLVSQVDFQYYGTEIPLQWNIYKSRVGAKAYGQHFKQVILLDSAGLAGPLGVSIAGNVDAEVFDWHPFWAILAGKFPPVSSRFMGDYHNITILSQEQLGAIHRACVLSELNAYMT